MRVAFTSDLHVDYKLEVAGLVARRAAEGGADLLILAGDICPQLGRLQAALRVIAEVVPKVLFVPGNHDLWCVAGRTTGRQTAPHDSRVRYTQLLPEIADRVGAVYLGLSPHVHKGVAFVGVTGWYDYTLRSERLDHEVSMEAYRGKTHAGIEWMDGKNIHWPDHRGVSLPDEELSAWMAELLAHQLNMARRVADRVVVVTHMLTHRGMVAETGEVTHDFIMGYLGSSRLGEVIDRNPYVVQVLSGHYHRPLNHPVDRPGPSLVCEVSPMGYPREYEGTAVEQVANRVRFLDI